MLSRRSFFRGLGALLAAPPIAKVVSLIPPLEAVRVRSYLTLAQYHRLMVRQFVNSNSFLANIDRQYEDAFGNDSPIPKVGTQLRIRLPSDYKVS